MLNRTKFNIACLKGKPHTMLEKEDLKLGNYVIGKTVSGNRDIIEKVLALTESGIATSEFSVRSAGGGKGYEIVQQIDTEHTLPYVVAQGVPITDKWLLGLGFSLITYEYQTYSRAGITVRISAGRCIIYHDSVPTNYSVEFVHELQNLYYSLQRYMLTLPPGIQKPSY